MTASFTHEEFRDYLRGLELSDMEGITGFVRPYLEELKKHQSSDPETLNKHFIRYCLVMAEFGPVLLRFAEYMLEEQEYLRELKERIMMSADQEVGQEVGR